VGEKRLLIGGVVGQTRADKTFKRKKQRKQ
jgi:hypothetical protein